MTEEDSGRSRGAFDAVLAGDPGDPRLRVAVFDRDGGTVQTAVTRTPWGVPAEAMRDALPTCGLSVGTRADVARARLGDDGAPPGARVLLPPPTSPSLGEGHS